VPENPPQHTTVAAGSGKGIFATTHWSVVLVADAESEAGRVALEKLCRTYWFPVYALVRARGSDPETARDLAQDFFAKMLSQEGLHKARRERGRFRSFLSQAVKNFLADEWDKSQTLKRGGGRPLLSLDLEAAEGRYHEQTDPVSPDVEFDRRWAGQILAEAKLRFENESEAAGRGEIFRVLERVGDPDAPSLAEEAGRLGLTLNTLKSHLHRARLRHARIIRELVAETVSTPADVEEELQQLLMALNG